MSIATEPRAGEPASRGVSKGRVEALSDGVFAIVVTLLVLEIKVPHVAEHGSVAALADALGTLAPKFVSWVISFATVCVIWLNHHRLFMRIGRLDNGLFWLNANLQPLRGVVLRLRDAADGLRLRPDAMAPASPRRAAARRRRP
jgi:uncharacterized membrane protein